MTTLHVAAFFMHFNAAVAFDPEYYTASLRCSLTRNKASSVASASLLSIEKEMRMVPEA